MLTYNPRLYNVLEKLAVDENSFLPNNVDLRRRYLKSVDDRQTTEAYLSYMYKLTNEPSAQVS